MSVTPVPCLSDAATPTLVELEAEICAVAASMAASKARLLALVGAFDAADGWVAAGAITCAHWLAGLLDIELSTARDQVRVARALPALPATRGRFDAGEVSYAKVRQLTRVATPESEVELLALAERCPAGQLPRALAAWQHRHDPDGLRRRQEEERGLSYRSEADGTTTISVRLLPEEFAEAQAIIDSEALRSKDADASADASVRTLRRRRADAFCRLLTSPASTTGTARRPELVLHRRAGTFELLDGTPLHGDVARRLICDADVRLMTHGPDGCPADVGRLHRLVTPRLRRLVQERDRHCQYHGCRAVHFTQVHHIVDWDYGGATVLANLVLLCGYHHRFLHRRGWPAEGTPELVRRALATPGDKLRRPTLAGSWMQPVSRA